MKRFACLGSCLLAGFLFGEFTGPRSQAYQVASLLPTHRPSSTESFAANRSLPEAAEMLSVDAIKATADIKLVNLLRALLDNSKLNNYFYFGGLNWNGEVGSGVELLGLKQHEKAIQSLIQNFASEQQQFELEHMKVLPSEPGTVGIFLPAEPNDRAERFRTALTKEIGAAAADLLIERSDFAYQNNEWGTVNRVIKVFTLNANDAEYPASKYVESTLSFPEGMDPNAVFASATNATPSVIISLPEVKQLESSLLADGEMSDNLKHLFVPGTIQPKQ